MKLAFQGLRGRNSKKARPLGRLLGEYGGRGGWVRRLAREGGGAALVEFALAIMPIFALFFGMVQWSINAYVNLIVQHAAAVAARALAVELPAMPDNGSASGTTSDLVKAITPLFAHVPNLISIDGFSPFLSVKIEKQAKNTCDQSLNTVEVKLTYLCTVPLGNAIACGGGLSGWVGSETGLYYQKLSAKASFPNQGSYYQKVWSKKIGTPPKGASFCSTPKGGT